MKNFQEMINSGDYHFEGMDASFFLIGLLSAFDNRYQAKADTFFEEMSWKQFFAIICINMCKESPTLKELADVMGSSHQNVKQILNKLEQKGFVAVIPDEQDKRKQRIVLTEKTERFCAEHNEGSLVFMEKMFAGIDSESIQQTIRTILMMEKNLEGIDSFLQRRVEKMPPEVDGKG